MDYNLLNILACPLCKGKLIYWKSTEELVCKFDKLVFPIHDGIPVMLEDRARRLSDQEVSHGI